MTTPATTSTLTKSLWERYQVLGDQQAREQLLDQYLGLVHHIARQIGASPSASRLSGWLVAVSPAFVFWCGALYKEGLVLLILSLGIYHALQLQTRWQTRSFCILSLCLIGLCALRLYLALIVALTTCLGLLYGRAASSRPHRFRIRHPASVRSSSSS